MVVFYWILSPILGYLLGSLPTGIIVARARGIKIREVGSGNIGATNVLRAVGVIPALIVMLADPLKGVVAVLIAKALGLSDVGIALTGLAAILGNDYNIFLGFKGGKGVATSLGVFLMIEPIATLGGLTIAAFTMALGRYVSLGSLAGIFSAILFVMMKPYTPIYLMLVITIFILAMIKHKENLIRLAQGTEKRLGQKPKQPEETGDTVNVESLEEVTDDARLARDRASP